VESIFPGRIFTNKTRTSFINKKPMNAPIIGARTMNRIVLVKTAASRIESLGVCASAAPANAPINAWDDEDGRPHHQVSKFQVMAPMSVARMTPYVTLESATPLAIAADTWLG
jgi:hypothetical protein